MYERSGHIIRQKFREYLLPTVMTSMAISMASVVDGIIVGSLLGEVALAAVGLSGPIIFCINLIYMLFAVGCAYRCNEVKPENGKPGTAFIFVNKLLRLYGNIFNLLFQNRTDEKLGNPVIIHQEFESDIVDGVGNDHSESFCKSTLNGLICQGLWE